MTCVKEQFISLILYIVPHNTLDLTPVICKTDIIYTLETKLSINLLLQWAKSGSHRGILGTLEQIYFETKVSCRVTLTDMASLLLAPKQLCSILFVCYFLHYPRMFVLLHTARNNV